MLKMMLPILSFGSQNLIVSKRGKKSKDQLSVSVKSKRYTVELARTHGQLLAAYRLRYRSLKLEMSRKPSVLPIDIDLFDRRADCLIITDRASDTVIGTYRLLSSMHTSTYYSQGEFDIGPLLTLPGKKLELSRACILPEHRNGASISLLWQGIYQYMLQTNTKYLFGCCSVFAEAGSDLSNLYTQISERNGFLDKPLATPYPKFNLSRTKIRNDEAIPIPPLMSAYLRAGAKLVATPAYDKAFSCYDFFTILDTDHLDPRITNRYQKRIDN